MELHVITMKMMWQRYQKFASYNPIDVILVDTSKFLNGLMSAFTLKLPKINSSIDISEEDYINESCIHMSFGYNNDYNEIYTDSVVTNTFIKHTDSDPNHNDQFDEYIEKIFGLRRNEEYDEYCLIKEPSESN